ncbi:MAG: hypothetical protein QW303_07855, partial [Nitrososphaerota archaeon]
TDNSAKSSSKGKSAKSSSKGKSAKSSSKGKSAKSSSAQPTGELPKPSFFQNVKAGIAAGKHGLLAGSAVSGPLAVMYYNKCVRSGESKRKCMAIALSLAVAGTAAGYGTERLIRAIRANKEAEKSNAGASKG